MSGLLSDEEFDARLLRRMQRNMIPLAGAAPAAVLPSGLLDDEERAR